jgi:hypothetical protein
MESTPATGPHGATGDPRGNESVESVAPTPPDEPVEDVPTDDSVLADAPDTSTGKAHLVAPDEELPGPGV